MNEPEKELSLDKIEHNRFNPNVMSAEEFENLKADMKEAGPNHDVINEIIVSPKNVFYSDPKLPGDVFVIVDGAHRYDSAHEIGWKTIPYEPRDITEAEAKAINYRKNKERGNIDPLKEAELFKSELDAGLTQEAVAKKYNVSRSHVANRLSLLKLDEKVVETFRKPEKVFKKKVVQKHEEKVAEYEKSLEDDNTYMSEPEPPTEEDFVPHGTLTPSHLEAIASLPQESQAEITIKVLDRGLSVRQTEELAKREKERLALEERLKKALEVAKRKTCPRCGAPPDGFGHGNENLFKCSRCWERWDYTKSQAEVDAEKQAEKTEHDKQAKKELVEKFKEARENPKYIRTPETPKQLHEKTAPYVLRKVQELTELSRVQIHGKRGEETVEIDYTPPSSWNRMSLRVQIGRKVFNFSVQEKAYKQVDAKARVDMNHPMKPSEETRKQLRQFFAEVVETSEDPPGAKN